MPITTTGQRSASIAGAPHPTSGGAVRAKGGAALASTSAKLADYYKILKVRPDASRDEIVRGFWSAAEAGHPERTDAKGARGRFVTIFEAFRIIGNPVRRRAYDRLGAIERDFERTRDPSWPRFTHWVESARREGATLADADYDRLLRNVLISNTLLSLRIIAIGEEAPDALLWLAIIFKISALALTVFFFANFAEFAVAPAEAALPDLHDLGETSADRMLVGVGMSAAVSLAYFALLILLGGRSSASESILARAPIALLKFFFTSQDEAFPLLPCLLVFSSVYAILAEVLARSG
jgi:hypothetical protein